MASGQHTSNVKKRWVQRAPYTAVFLLVAFMAGVLSFLYYSQIRAAKSHRLRLLASLGVQVESTVEDQARRFVRILLEQPADDLAGLEKRLGSLAGTLDIVGDLEEDPGASGEKRLVMRPRGQYLELEYRGPALCGERTDVAHAASEGEDVSEDGTVSEKGEHEEEEGSRSGLAQPPVAALQSDGSTRSQVDDTDPAVRVDCTGAQRYEVTAWLRLTRFFEAMIQPDVFDAVLLAGPDGSVVYQAGEPELRLADLRHLLRSGDEETEEDAADLRGLARSNTVLSAQLADVSYQVFLQTVPFRLAAPYPGVKIDREPWTVCGVVSRQRLLSSSLSASPWLLFLVLAVFPLALVTFPFLKLHLISPYERFRRIDAVMVILASCLGLALLTFLVFDFGFLTRTTKVVENQLEELADVLAREAQFEVLDARRQLLEVNRYVAGLEAEDPLLEEISAFKPLTCREDQDLCAELRHYPYLHNVFWANKNGRQLGKVAFTPESALRNQVGNRLYFECAMGKREPFAMRLPWEGRVRYDGARFGETPDWTGFTRDGSDLSADLCLQSVLDRTTGRQEVVLAMDVDDLPAPWPEPALRHVYWPNRLLQELSPWILGPPYRPGALLLRPPPDRSEEPSPPRFTEGKLQAAAVTALVTPFLSLREAVLLPGISFAVIDPTGLVLFHSAPRRNLSENFLKASDQDGLLASLLRQRRNGHLVLNYWGQRHRAFVRNLHGLPFTLVTLRSTEDVRVRNFELLYDFSMSLLLLFGLAGLVVGLTFWHLPARGFKLLWPSKNFQHAYCFIAIGALLVMATLWGIIGIWGPQYGILAGLILPILFVMGSIFSLYKVEKKEREKKDFAGLSGVDDEDEKMGETENVQATSEAALDPAVEDSESAPGVESSPLSERIPSVLLPLLAVAEIVRSWITEQFHKNEKKLFFVIPPVGVVLTVWWLEDSYHFLGFALLTLGGYVWLYRSFFRHHWSRNAYRLALACLLLVIAVLPAVAAFSAAESRQSQFLLQDSQVALAKRLEKRRESLGAREPAEAYRLYRSALDGAEAQTLEAYFGSRRIEIEDPGPGRQLPWAFGREGRELLSNWMFLRPLPLDHFVRARHGTDLTRLPGRGETWRWFEDGVLGVFREDEGTGARLSLWSDLSVLQGFSYGRFWRNVGLALGFLLLVGLPLYLARFIADNVALAPLTEVDAGMTVKSLLSRLSPQEKPGSGTSTETGARVLLVTGLPDELLREGAELSDQAWEWIDLRALTRQELLSHPKTSTTKTVTTTTTQQVSRSEGHVATSTTVDEKTDFQREEIPPKSYLLTGLDDFISEEELVRKPSVNPDDEDKADQRQEGAVSLEVEAENGIPKDPSAAPEPAFGRPQRLNAFIDFLSKVKSSHVVVVTRRPPDVLEDDSPAPRQHLKRWARHLAGFTVRYARDEGAPAPFEATIRGLHKVSGADNLLEKEVADKNRLLLETECRPTGRLQRIGHQIARELKPGELEMMTRTQLLSRIGMTARPYYHALWSRADNQEKLILVQLAEEGVINPKQFDRISGLLHKGLILRDADNPALRLLNQSFANFVRRETSRAEVAEWEDTGGLSAWSMLKWILPLPLLFLGAYLFLTQRDAITNVVGVAIAAASILPTFLNLFQHFRQTALEGSKSQA
jgi:hypothetical protein